MTAFQHYDKRLQEMEDDYQDMKWANLQFKRRKSRSKQKVKKRK